MSGVQNDIISTYDLANYISLYKCQFVRSFFKTEEKFENKHESIDKSSMLPLHAHLSTLNHQNMTIFKKAWYRLQETLLIIKYEVYIHNNIYDIHNLMNIHNDYTSVNLRFALHLNHLCHLVFLLHLECFVFFVKPCVGTPVSRYLW